MNGFHLSGQIHLSEHFMMELIQMCLDNGGPTCE